MTKLFSIQVRDELERTTKAAIIASFNQFKSDMTAKFFGKHSEAQAKSGQIMTRSLLSSIEAELGSGAAYILKPVTNQLSSLATGVIITIKSQVIIDK